MNGFQSHLLALLLLLIAPPAWPGGSPETTLLLVNADSPVSLAVANEYIRLRDLPEQQVLWLRNIPVGETIDIDSFRRHILDPVRNHFIRTGLGNEIDLIAYSAGFPYRVDFSPDLQRAGLEYHKRVGNTGSLTGLTYFMHRVAAMDMGYLHPRANQYFRPLRTAPEGTGIAFAASRGFRSRHVWTQGSSRVASSAFDRYYLSVMLGYAGMRGNSLPEIVEYLGTAAAADGAQPDGTVYLMKNRNIRSRVRQPFFPALQQALQERGRAVEVTDQGQPGQDGRVPRQRRDIIGLVAGTRTFDWGADSRMLPGAIAESFTSYGGHFSHGVQTKLSEFLRNGAAGSSGAVQEPFSFVEKFPLPQLHQYYADGCSLAEAFYQSLSSPYQLLIVGDPLARPFARFAQLELLAPDTDRTWHGKVTISLRAVPPPGRVLERVELWVDGRPMAHGRPGATLKLDTLQLTDGHHDLRLVAVEEGDIETRSYLKRTVRVENRGHRVSLFLERTGVSYGASVTAQGLAEDARRVMLYQGRRILAEAEVVDGRWQASLDSSLTGQGMIQLYAEAEYPGGQVSRSGVVRLDVAPPLVSREVPVEAPAREGVLAILDMGDGEREIHMLDGLGGGRRPREWGDQRPERVTLAGAFQTRAEGLYELDMTIPGRLGVKVNGVMMAGEAGPGEVTRISVPLPLSAGWHPFEIRYRPGRRDGLPRLSLQGPEPAFLLEGQRLRHSPDYDATY